MFLSVGSTFTIALFAETDDLAIAEAIKDVEQELKKTEKSVFNPTTVVMLLIAGGIVTSKIANMFFQ
jgi:hypothetical protein